MLSDAICDSFWHSYLPMTSEVLKINFVHHSHYVCMFVGCISICMLCICGECGVCMCVWEREMFYLTTHSTYFIYGYMASDIWLRTILIVRKETRCRHIGYSYRLTARVLLYAPSHRQDNTYHSLCYTSCGALAGTRNACVCVWVYICVCACVCGVCMFVYVVWVCSCMCM